MNQFGGDWTKMKIQMLVEYAQAYLTIMKKYPYWRTLYFDGFAGTGFIINDKAELPEVTIGAARRIVEINEPKSFNGYYFVEKDPANYEMLKATTKDEFPDKTIYVVQEDCNVKLKSMADHFKKPKQKRDFDKVLAYIDPCGMQLEWSSIGALEGIGADAWILVPTGMGVNRLLKRNGQISNAWLTRLELFLGMDEEEIKTFFFTEKTETTLFGEWKKVTKKERAIEQAATLYKNRLGNIFKHVTEPMALKNDGNVTIYHLIFVSNNAAALNIANDIIKKYSQ